MSDAAATITALMERLTKPLTQSLPEASYGEPAAMERASAEVQTMLGGAGPAEFDRERFTRAVQRLYDDEQLSTSDLRRCCTAATTPLELTVGEVRLADDRDIVARLMSRLQSSDPRHHTRFAYALAHAWLSPSKRPDPPTLDRLAGAITAMAKSSTRGGDVTQRIRGSAALFSSWNAQRFLGYVTALDEQAVDELTHLSTPTTSWVWEEIITAGLTAAATAERDATYRDKIAPRLALLERHEHLIDAGLGLMLKRIADGSDRDEHPLLRDLSVERWGNPLQASTERQWSQWTTRAARNLVAGWLARVVIRGFFDVVAGGQSDPTRTRFWSQYAEEVSEFWIYLSEDARYSGGQTLADMRKILGSNVRTMKHASTSAFVMVLGDVAFVEFSETGNALYAYQRDRLPFKLAHGVPPTPQTLKDRPMSIDYLTHSGGWEARAEELILSLTGRRPSRA